MCAVPIQHCIDWFMMDQMLQKQRYPLLSQTRSLTSIPAAFVTHSATQNQPRYQLVGGCMQGNSASSCEHRAEKRSSLKRSNERTSFYSKFWKYLVESAQLTLDAQKALWCLKDIFQTNYIPVSTVYTAQSYPLIAYHF